VPEARSETRRTGDRAWYDKMVALVHRLERDEIAIVEGAGQAEPGKPMSFENTRETLRALHTELCAALRRGEMLWYGMASDYQSKYAFSADYDTAFKHRYYDQATACREIVEQLEALALPAVPEEAASFVAALKDAMARCPQPPDMRGLLESLAGKIESVASAAGAGGEETAW
jgi:hypothetical protein